LNINSLIFSELSESSNVKGFDCDLEKITSFLQDDALNYQRQKIANTYVFKDENENILAFFSISNDGLKDTGTEKGFTNLVWNKLHRDIKLPNSKRIRHYPSIKIGRLGVHKNCQGTGLAYQLMDFIKGWVSIDHKPACRLLILDAVNEIKQIRYYGRNDFKFLMASDEHSKTRLMYYDLLDFVIEP
jgi:GNAT superfamily N-acetyltransferase